MKKIVVSVVLVMWQSLPAQQVAPTPTFSRHPGAPPGYVGEKHPPALQLQNFVIPKKIASMTYSATFYTFNDIAVFSYFDSTAVAISSMTGTTIADTLLNADEFDTLSPGNGFYRISGNKPFAALTGDAITSFASGYFAVDESGSGVGTKLNTWMMMGPSDSDPHFILFSYGGQTDFALKDLSTGNLLYMGSIDTTGYFDFPNVSQIEGKAIQVTSDKPVSALSYTDQGYYVPSENGSFAGNLFYGFSGFVPPNENSITITSYSDNNAILVTNLSTGDTILVDTLNHWQVKTYGIYQDTFWKASSSGPATVADIPFAGWGLGSDKYYYLDQCADSTGRNIGNSFILPTIAGDMEIFSYADDNEVRVIQLGDTSYPYQSPVQVKDTVLQNGGVLVLTTPSGNNVYRVQSNNGVSVVQSFGGSGAAFVPIGNVSVNLPDLAIAQSDISFSPADSIYQTGQKITVNLEVHNFGTTAASNVGVVAYDGNPDLGYAPVLTNQSIPILTPGASANLSFSMIVPPAPQYHSIYVKVDPSNLISESNKSNNGASKYLSPNNYLRSPFAVYFSSPGALKLQEGALAPNPFTITADIFNTTDTAVTNPSLNIGASVSTGLEIISGTADTTVTTFLGGGHLTLTWQLSADKDSSGFDLFRLTLLRLNLYTNFMTVGILVPDTVAPPVPQGLTAWTDSSSPGSVELSWTADSVRDLAGFKVYYSTDSTNFLGGTGAKQGSSPIYVSASDTFVVSGLTNGGVYWFAVSSFDFSMNESSRSKPARIFVVAKVRQQGSTPKTFALFQNYPNPFNPSTVISYQLPGKSRVTLKIYDILGREVESLVDQEQEAGYYAVTLDAGNLPTGVYFYRINAGEFRAVKKLMVVK